MQLKPTLGPVQLTFYSVGVIIGAGVYSVIGAASAIAHEGLWLSFVIGGFVALLTGLSYAEMTTSFPAAGAEYSYMRRALPGLPWLSFIVAIAIVIGASATASTVAVAFGGYLREFADIPPTVSALLLLVGCTVLNIVGLRESSWANILFTCVEVGGLMLVIAAGFAQPDFTAPLRAPLHMGAIQAAAVAVLRLSGLRGDRQSFGGDPSPCARYSASDLLQHRHHDRSVCPGGAGRAGAREAGRTRRERRAAGARHRERVAGRRPMDERDRAVRDRQHGPDHDDRRVPPVVFDGARRRDP